MCYKYGENYETTGSYPIKNFGASFSNPDFAMFLLVRIVPVSRTLQVCSGV